MRRFVATAAITITSVIAAAGPAHPDIAGEAPGHHDETKHMVYKGKAIDPRIIDANSPTGLNLKQIADNNANARDGFYRFDGTDKDQGASFEGLISMLPVEIKSLKTNKTHIAIRQSIINKKIKSIQTVTGISEAQLKNLKKAKFPEERSKTNRLLSLHTHLNNLYLNCQKSLPEERCSHLQTAVKDTRDKYKAEATRATVEARAGHS